jgi:hypothetical protein
LQDMTEPHPVDAADLAPVHKLFLSQILGH